MPANLLFSPPTGKTEVKPMTDFGPSGGLEFVSKRQHGKQGVSLGPGLSQILRAKRTAATFGGDRSWVNGVVHPPGAVVVPDVVVRIGLVDAYGQFLLCGGV